MKLSRRLGDNLFLAVGIIWLVSMVAVIIWSAMRGGAE